MENCGGKITILVACLMSAVLLKVAVESVSGKTLDPDVDSSDLPVSLLKYKGKYDLKDFASWPTTHLIDVFYSFVLSTEILCHRRIRVGKLGDGGWDVCDDEKYRPKENCLIYSFGIDNRWSFDDKAAKIYKCEIHSFDPSIGLRDHKRSEHVTFHDIGLAGNDSEFGGPKKNWKMMTLGSIRKMLGHEKRVIDVLKMDIEDSEWNTFQRAFKDGSLDLVGQLLMEQHSNHDRWRLIRNIPILVELYRRGFKRYLGVRNEFCPLPTSVPFPGATAGCHEVYYINTKTLK